MLKSVQNFENQNLKNHLKKIAVESFDKITESLNNEQSRKEIQKASFKSALQGIRSGIMQYESDPLLPMLQSEMTSRINHFKGLSPADESKLLKITTDQRKIIVDNDRK